jgi:hypothetical protein
VKRVPIPKKASLLFFVPVNYEGINVGLPIVSDIGNYDPDGFLNPIATMMIANHLSLQTLQYGAG